MFPSNLRFETGTLLVRNPFTIHTRRFLWFFLRIAFLLPVIAMAQKPEEAKSQSTTVAVPSGAEYLNLIATINLTKETASIKFVSRSDRPQQDEPVGLSEISIRITDSKGQVLDRYPVSLTKESDQKPTDDVVELAQISFPFDLRMTTLEIVLHGKVIAFSTIALDQNTNKVTNLKARYASTLSDQERRALGSPNHAVSDQTLLFQWDAVGMKKRDASYTVQMSTDGKTWATVAVALTQPRFKLDPTDFGLNPGDRISVRVIANVGAGKSSQTTGTFEIRP